MAEEMDSTKSASEETIELLKSIEEKSNNCHKMGSNLLMRLKDNELLTQNGNSFVELKNRVFLSYLMDLTYLVLKKVSGQRLEGSDVIQRLVEHRTVLERMRPIEHKLRYTFDKLIKTSTDGTVDPNDPLRFKPQLNSIVGTKDTEDMGDEEYNSQNDDMGSNDDMEESGDNGKKVRSDVYVPPKVAQMRFDVEEDRKAKALERAKKKALNSSIISELRREFDDRPEEVTHSVESHNKMNRFLKDKTVFEEEYMTRMSLTKKQRNEAKQMRIQSMTSTTAGLTHFGDITALDIDHNSDYQFSKQKKRTSSKNKKYKKGFKKFKK
ncbi:unnamed protein product [Medioppia subpectinata]|uniref:Neuroguidin n=1 Tax=Medioppia subpectinata TaxID=1979941 RepID=A0A7R9LA42_9ACAR|nr:unnamed protein product [Medioppia subpectinata]CAG2117200.1 unnamed protein product [Medioppia subpectinata]